MRGTLRVVMTCFGVVCCFGTKAQDVHFSQFFASPMYTNPALAGDFSGTYRFNALARRQWSAVSPQPYQTVCIGADMNGLFGVRPLNGGLILYRDAAGVSAFTITSLAVPIGGTFRFGASKRVRWSFAAMPGWLGVSVDRSKMTFGDQFQDDKYDPSNPTLESIGFRSVSTFNLGAGSVLERRWTNRKYLKFGYSVFNITEPDYGIGGGRGSVSALPRRHNVHVITSMPITETIDIMPALQWLMQQTHTNLLAGTNFKFHTEGDDEPELSLLAGLWYRHRDAVNLNLGLTNGNLFTGVGYDINYSSLNRASGFRGGWEFAVIYTHATVREKVKRQRLCPDYL